MTIAASIALTTTTTAAIATATATAAATRSPRRLGGPGWQRMRLGPHADRNVFAPLPSRDSVHIDDVPQFPPHHVRAVVPAARPRCHADAAAAVSGHKVGRRPSELR